MPCNKTTWQNEVETQLKHIVSARSTTIPRFKKLFPTELMVTLPYSVVIIDSRLIGEAIVGISSINKVSQALPKIHN